MIGNPILETKDLVQSYGEVRAVDGVSLTIGRGSITGLIGPNGAGKTSLFRLVSGQDRPKSGEVRFDGARIDGWPADRIFRRGLARSFQIPRPFARLTTLENVMVAAPGQSGERVWANWLRAGEVREGERRLRQKAMEVLAFTGLADKAGELAGRLSGGQQKLLELARTSSRSRASCSSTSRPPACIRPCSTF